MIQQVLVVEDDPMAQQLLSLYIEKSPRYKLVEAISSADYADIYCERFPIDLVLMDIRTAMHANGLDAAERIKKKYPQIKIIVVTSMPEESYLMRAREIGVDSFWYKDINREPFEKLMDRTMDGEHIFPDRSPVIQFGQALSTDFSEREMEILRELVTGASNLDIADKLFITESTVKVHVKAIMKKTGFSNRTELAVKAQKTGIVSMD